MRCGKCKEEDVTIDHVKNCYSSGLTPVTESPMWPATEPQVDYVMILQRQQSLPDSWVLYDKPTLHLLERDEVSHLIEALKEFPTKRVGKMLQTSWTMPAGRYALFERGEVGFYKVDKPTKGRWDGYVFVKRLIGAPGDYREVPIDRAQRSEILDTIQNDPKAAMERYGHETMTCGRCGSPLTDPQSRAAGIGPVCIGKEW